MNLHPKKRLEGKGLSSQLRSLCSYETAHGNREFHVWNTVHYKQSNQGTCIVGDGARGSDVWLHDLKDIKVMYL